MDPGTIIGIVVGIAAILIGMTMEGAHLSSLIEPSSAMIVIVGTIGATMGGYMMKDVTGLGGVIKSGLLGKPRKPDDAIKQMVQMAERARREGLLSLEDAAKTIEDPFLQKGIQMAVDGTDPDELREILETEIAAMKARHKAGGKFFADLGAFAPTLGIIGTVIGLVHMLENLEDPSTAGPAIAVAFTATLYGVMTANLLFLPMGNKLKRMSELEAHHMELLMEGILSIQAGANPRIIEQKLLSFLAPKQRKAIEQSRAA
ncbi:MAG TPA: flagellar motor protein [Egibacteraceae bacterium]|nr:flagellar motor protein [Egibacteraceae bacterium]